MATPSINHVAAYRAALARAESARDGDSNDAEIEALWATVEAIGDLFEALTSPASRNDSDVIDAIATYLGLQAEWPGADTLEVIADLISLVRPHPGDVPADEYADVFTAATGRPVPLFWINLKED